MQTADSKNRSCRRAAATVSTALVATALLSSSMAPCGAQAQAIVKWTDDKGQVHYSDHAPPGHTTASAVATMKLKPAEPSAPTLPRDAFDAGNRIGPGSGMSSIPPDETQGPISISEQERKRRLAEQQKAANAARQKADKAVIDRCRADHETYCDQGADVIRERDRIRAELQCDNPAACANVRRLSETNR